jgi:hypothetical protein
MSQLRIYACLSEHYRVNLTLILGVITKYKYLRSNTNPNK